MSYVKEKRNIYTICCYIVNTLTSCGVKCLGVDFLHWEVNLGGDPLKGKCCVGYDLGNVIGKKCMIL